MFRLTPGPVILCADDYGLSAGVSQGILELAMASRISALSAIVTLPRWPEDAARLEPTRDKVSVGLHVNLTLGAPLGAMPRLAPDGRLPTVGTLLKRALARDLDAGEIEAEVGRQVDAFERHTGHRPDHVDGHQHVHAMPLIRKGFLDALGSRFTAAPRPLVRDPGDRWFSISGRGGEMAKAYGLAALTYGFKWLAHRRGFPTNRGFSGYSAFDTTRSYDLELASAMRMSGAGHMVMCHPGHPDDELRGLDPVVERRAQELASIMSNPELKARIWHPGRPTRSGLVDWQGLIPHAR